MSRFGVLLVAIIGLSGCSLLDKVVYRIDIPQGNYLEQEDVDKLRVGMTEEQVIFVLGNPVAENSFDSDRWVYLYNMDPNSGKDFRKELVLTFNNKQLQDFKGDFDKPKNFEQPLDQ
ncbi:MULTISPECIES: outer membrane protein assembly factor BamE [Idiomarina]|jgi:outer membrane protein assembly factor BamE|uniref:outer membrane protein assembly factor BamE n=1 Tax=Idiomarina TaxID=135575 RepID=UPI000C5BE7E1|nr:MULTISPECIES: outer membrane protein assembly factor BamE [Idiomarina]MAO67634.1 outer membrane assembly protein BamE [Idiomarina sp.]MBF79492.1 outer membrane assembly protein BamE [Idiomarina sp.]|tara:strand:+ start:22374 stop:22724 length:351 start_codon:yes stop_codon:yes gene_type:complete